MAVAANQTLDQYKEAFSIVEDGRSYREAGDETGLSPVMIECYHVREKQASEDFEAEIRKHAIAVLHRLGKPRYYAYNRCSINNRNIAVFFNRVIYYIYYRTI